MSKKRFKILTKKMSNGKIIAFRTILGIFVVLFILSLALHILVFGNFISTNLYTINFYFTEFTIDYSYDVFSGYYLYSLIILVVEILIIAFFSFLLYFSLKNFKKHREVLNLKDFHTGKTTTDLDNLYEILKQKKTLSIPLISSTFKVSNEVVMEWGKILERGNLARINYPHMSDPELIFTESIKSTNNENEED